MQTVRGRASWRIGTLWDSSTSEDFALIHVALHDLKTCKSRSEWLCVQRSYRYALHFAEQIPHHFPADDLMAITEMLQMPVR